MGFGTRTVRNQPAGPTPAPWRPESDSTQEKVRRQCGRSRTSHTLPMNIDVDDERRESEPVLIVYSLDDGSLAFDVVQWTLCWRNVCAV
ncbi:hypothetical protein MHYP_G00034380 [Metynnis hypsauchen]